MLLAFVFGVLIGALITWVVLVAPLHERLESFEQAAIDSVHQADTLIQSLEGLERLAAEKIVANLTDVMDEESNAQIVRRNGVDN